MSAEEPQPTQQSQDPPHGGSAEPSEDELRAAYEAELSRLTSADLIAQAIVSLLNVGARRLGPLDDGTAAAAGPDQGAGSPRARAAPERDLAQVRDAIDAVRALLEILERSLPGEGLRPLRDALAQLQRAYAREVQAGAATAAGGGAQAAAEPDAATPGEGSGEAGGAAAQDAPQSEEGSGEPGPAQRSGRLWVPGS